MAGIIARKDYPIENFSNIPSIGGKVLVIGIGGAGIPSESKILNENLRKALNYVPYLNTSAGQIDYIMLTQKDSADLSPEEVAMIAKVIYDLQSDYDGFVVISGSDAIVYIASATAFSLNCLNIPVIFIGARQTANNIDSDFRLNLPNAIKTAVMGYNDVNAPSIGETAILFDDTLTRATVSVSRGTKVNNPIESPRLPRLAEVGWTVKTEIIAKAKQPPQTNYSYNINKNIAYFDLVSQTNLDSFEILVEDSNIDGIIIGAFGAGNIPSVLIPLIHKAVHEKGKIVAAVTNCKKGSSDMGLYDCGALAVKAGTISLGPMVKPAAIEKMRWALNNARGEDRIKYQKDVARLLLTEVAGEIPTLYAKYAINKLKETFLKESIPLEKIYRKPEPRTYNREISRYCISPDSEYKILVICMGGTFFQEPNLEGSLAPTKRTLKELFDKKLEGISKLASLDYCELVNLDSTELDHKDRVEAAKLIAKNMDRYDGFILLHGTDTLAFTAGALSFMLQGLEKDIVLTGAQKPGFDFSDFDRNFTNSVKVIIERLKQKNNNQVRAGVKLAFGDKLITGTTVTKEDEHGLNAFAPIPKHALAGVLCNPLELYHVVKTRKRPFTLFTDFDTQVAYYECICAGDLKQFERLIENPKISAILIGGFDEGNMPLELKYYIATAVNSYEKPIVFISNTDYGVAKTTLEGRFGEFIRAGAISLADMTKGAAFQKLQFSLGLAKKQKDIYGRKRIEFIRRVLHTNLADETCEEECKKANLVYAGLFTEDKTKELFSEDEIFNRITKSSEYNLPLGEKEESKET
ncbi:MAG: asparaginase domain-containing protein [Candidatus Pacearchaeota archaeon]|jgi:L-asparaginase